MPGKLFGDKKRLTLDTRRGPVAKTGRPIRRNPMLQQVIGTVPFKLPLAAQPTPVPYRKQHILKMGIEKPLHKQRPTPASLLKRTHNHTAFGILVDLSPFKSLKKIIKGPQPRRLKKRLP